MTTALYISFANSKKPASVKELIELCEKYSIGYVSRVDMLKRGAHIFVDWFYDVNLRNELSKTHPYQIMLCDDTWWNIFEARSALPEAKFNIHQLNNKIMKMENTILLLKRDLDIINKNASETILTIRKYDVGIILIFGSNGLGVVIDVNNIISLIIVISLIYYFCGL